MSHDILCNQYDVHHDPVGEKKGKGTFGRQICVYVSVCCLVVVWLSGKWQC